MTDLLQKLKKAGEGRTPGPWDSMYNSKSGGGHWTERAAIHEYDGGVTRAKAERLATLRWHRERKARE